MNKQFLTKQTKRKGDFLATDDRKILQSRQL